MNRPLKKKILFKKLLIHETVYLDCFFFFNNLDCVFKGEEKKWLIHC